MKRFFRSAVGKVLLMIAFWLCCAAVIFCATGAVYSIAYDIYQTDEASFVRQLESDRLAPAVENIVRQVLEDPSAGTENLTVSVRSADGKVLAQSERFIENTSDTVYYQYNANVSGKKIYIFGPITATADLRTSDLALVTAAVPRQAAEQLLSSAERQLIRSAFSLRYLIWPVGAVALLLGLVLLVWLLSVSGRRPGDDEVHDGPFTKFPLDLLLFLLALGTVWYCDAFLFGPGGFSEAEEWILLEGSLFLVCVIGTLLLMSIAVRVKRGVLWKNTVIAWVLRLLKKAVTGLIRLSKRMIRTLPLVWRTALGVTALSLAELMFLLLCWYSPETLLCFFLLEKCLLIPGTILMAAALRRLQQAGSKLAEGDLDYQTDTRGLHGLFREHAEHLNRISDGMKKAVDQRLKSERMKTELLTNVSHDLKTPLTSVVNYAGLIENEQTENENIRQYASVLSRQAAKLKRLIEDLVEASKATTGTLEVSPEPCSVSVLLSQTLGEYSEKLVCAGLTPVSSIPEEDLWILADGKRMWRVLDNLLNNVCAYALAGTRVYLSAERADGKAVITVKNTSRDPLNVSAEELMERFVRGDSSRHAEGNGLGLSIARSFTELQGGTMDLTVDGDLFKVILRFPEEQLH